MAPDSSFGAILHQPPLVCRMRQRCRCLGVVFPQHGRDPHIHREFVFKMFVHDGSLSVIVCSLLGPPSEALVIVPDFKPFVSIQNPHASPSNRFACPLGHFACARHDFVVRPRHFFPHLLSNLGSPTGQSYGGAGPPCEIWGERTDRGGFTSPLVFEHLLQIENAATDGALPRERP